MLDSKEIARIAARTAVDKKAENIIILNLSNLLGIVDYFVICEGKNDRQVDYISEFIKEKLRENGVKPYGVEGDGRAGWILLDYGNVVIHVFTSEARQYYQIERLWKDAPHLEWEEVLKQKANAE
ncbi:ribosome silencing factor [Candidatus Oleimmundimicrobium sp.]|uniref:ribosome silencing factor n=1 Tax=Candidatus Oleimmundimicrobium sp. TaxID=3060597 RepID=UPI00271A56DE|nr:ribosome silencing factor [Candidatus Oleimmundimicrobium sp.]MDO8886154.1 ribosome silencing factor [Candidatus Oleimmundimicrobium sp.]